MTSVASTDWPRAYLFQIHAEAIAHGLIFLEGLTKEDAKSLKQRLYRIRRRSDKANAVFIPPEYHLVTVGEWEEMPSAHPAYPGRLPIIYNKMPGGKELPRIRPATEGEASLPMAPSKMLPAPPALTPEQLVANLEDADMTLKPEEIDSFVNELINSAEAREADDDA